MSIIYNFSAGPATLPMEVKEQAQSEFINWQDSGQAIFEISHRSPAFESMMSEAEKDLRDLLSIPEDYSVLFLQGGASLQFVMIPLNFAKPGDSVCYIDSGSWSKKAIQEAQRTQHVEVIAGASETAPYKIECPEVILPEKGCRYVHYTPNETISGVEFPFVPKVQGDIPLIADMSSTILSRPVDISQFDMIYAGAQKNIGPPGLVVVIIKNDMLSRTGEQISPILSYKTHAQAKSLYNTPPSFSCYMAALAFKWLLKQGGLTQIAERNQKKAERLYQFIDDSWFYSNPVHPSARSLMNIPFLLGDNSEALNKRFLKESEACGLMALEGHRSVGGMRASLYNAMPIEGVSALIEFMQRFEKNI